MYRLSNLDYVKKLAESSKLCGTIKTKKLEMYESFYLEVVFAPTTDYLIIVKGKNDKTTKLQVKGFSTTVKV
jgi:TfoX/Sxy family transcriptional regulator of competence genes